MCRWCYLTPACPCRRGGEPPEVAIGRAAIAILLIVCALAIAACGDTDAGGDEGGTTVAESNEPILIRTRLFAPDGQGKASGKVLSGSTIGDSAFCARGKFVDGPVQVPERSVLRSFRCPGGNLSITFSSTPPGVEQRSDWKVVNGVGRFEEAGGGGRMKGELDSGGGGGRETFTGTVTR